MASTTTGLSNLMSTFYDKVFLERAKNELRYDFGATVKKAALNQGKSIIFNRLTPLALVTAALTEAANPAEVAMTSTQVTATLAEYGTYTTIGSLFKMTSIDDDLKEHVEVHGQNAGESIDNLLRLELSAGGTRQLVATQAAVSSTSAIHTSDVITGLEIRKAVRTLKLAKAPRFPGAMYRGIIGPQVAMDLFGASEWLDAHRYTTSDAIERGVIGKLHGVEFVESNNPTVTLSGGFSTSTTDVANTYETYVFGRGGYAMVSLDSFSAPKIYVKNPGAGDTSNPLDLWSTVGWKMPFAAKTLNSSWIIKIITGATNGNSAAL
jgi:N4-gp56 family major capsid protein